MVVDRLSDNLDRADVVCIGGALMGSAVAHFLTTHPGFDGSVVVIERDRAYTVASSSLSGSSIREQFSEPVNIQASQFGMEFFDNFTERVGIDGVAPDLGFRGTGYLFLADEGGLEALRRNHRIQVEHGAEAILLSPTELGCRFPYLNLDGLAGGRLGSRREGSLDAWALLQGLRQRAIHDGAHYRDDEVVGIRAEHGRAVSVSLASGATIECGHVINTAGPRAADVAAMLDIPLPVEPRVRSVFVVDCRAPIEAPVPLTITPEGVWFRREHDRFLCGVSPPVDPRAALDDFVVRHDEYEEIIWPALAHRVPQFDRLAVVGSWAGHYSVNTIDANMVIGPHPEIHNFYFANGFSGHGLQHAPAVGRAISELIVDGEFRTIDMTVLGYDRVLRGTKKKEGVVI